MGNCVDWQKVVENELKDFNVTILNPRRDNWDSSWKQSIDNPQFKGQVTWELDNLDAATFIFMYFDPQTKAPITLMELGLHARNKNVIVCCPHGFWRRGNIEVVCDRFKIPLFDDFNKSIQYLKESL